MRFWASVALFFAAAAPLCGQTLITAADRGWYVNNGFHGPTNDNYVVGDLAGIDTSEYRNFFVFDLTGVTQSVLSAELRLFNPIMPPGEANGFESVHGSEAYTLFDVTRRYPQLVAGTGGVSAFSDLGSGVVYANRTMTVADYGTTVVISLNAAALAYLNANLGSTVALGGALTTLDADFNNTTELAFAATRSTQVGVPATAAQLALTAVPEPATVALLGLSSLAGGAIAWRRYKQRRAVAAASNFQTDDS